MTLSVSVGKLRAIVEVGANLQEEALQFVLLASELVGCFDLDVLVGESRSFDFLLSRLKFDSRLMQAGGGLNVISIVVQKQGWKGRGRLMQAGGVGLKEQWLACNTLLSRHPFVDESIG